jgi:DNA-binding protein HU-beta
MTKADIINEITNNTGLQKRDVAAVVESFMECVKDSMCNKENVYLRGFGTFQPRARATKIGYNPSTGQPMPLPASTTILFKPSRELTKEMNG